jgi:hypothetical protein
MPNPRAGAPPAPPRLTSTVNDAVDLLERYAAADRDLAAELDRIGADASPSQRVSQATVTRLLRLLEESLVPGVQAKADLDALPNSLRWAGLARWAQQAVDRVERAIGWLFSPLADRCDGALLVRFAGPPTPARPADDRSHLGGGERPDFRTARLVRVA